jgi:hypothetical protein
VEAIIMRRVMLITLLAAVAFVVAPTVSAGEIYGKITKDGRSIGKGVMIHIVHQKTNSLYTCKTDTTGRYKIFVKKTGKCTLEIKRGGPYLKTTVYSFVQPNGYDFDIYVDRDNKLRMRSQ